MYHLFAGTDFPTIIVDDTYMTMVGCIGMSGNPTRLWVYAGPKVTPSINRYAKSPVVRRRGIG